MAEITKGLIRELIKRRVALVEAIGAVTGAQTALDHNEEWIDELRQRRDELMSSYNTRIGKLERKRERLQQELRESQERLGACQFDMEEVERQLLNGDSDDRK